MSKYFKIIFGCVFVTLLLVIVYRPALDNGFTGDDKYIYVANDFVKSWKNLPRLFTKDYISSLDKLNLLGHGDIGSGEMTYRPVCTLSYFCDYSIWKLNLFGPHLTNIVLHFIAAFLVYILALRIDLSRPAAIFTALVFVLHPVNNEVVAVITSRDDILAFVFFAFALILYQNFRNSNYGKPAYYYLSLGMYALAILSKEVAAALPVTIALYDHYFPPKNKKRFADLLKLYGGYVCILVAYLLIYAFVFSPSRSGILDYFGGNFIAAFATFVTIAVLYLKWLIVPWNIPATIADNGIVITNLLDARFLVSFLGILSVGTFVLLSFRNRRGRFLFAFFWSLVTILPVLIALPWMLNVLYAARFLYVPMVGFCFVLGLIWDASAKATKRPLIIYCLSIVLLVFYAFVTMNKLPMWKDDLTLGLERLNEYPRSSLALLNAGAAFEERGMPTEAALFYDQAVESDPSCSECHNQRGLLQLKLGDVEKAVLSFRQALSADPYDEVAENNLCSALGRQKNYSEATACFSGFLAKHPRSAKGYYNFGILYLEQGKVDEALKVWNAGLIVEPGQLELKAAVARFGTRHPGWESKP